MYILTLVQPSTIVSNIILTVIENLIPNLIPKMLCISENNLRNISKLV